MPGRTSRHGISSLYKKLGIIYIRLVRTRNKLTLVNFFMTPYQYFMWLSFTCIFGKRKITQNVFCSVENRIVKCSSWDCLEMWVRLYRPASMRGVSEAALFRDFYAKKSLSSLHVLGFCCCFTTLPRARVILYCWIAQLYATVRAARETVWYKFDRFPTASAHRRSKIWRTCWREVYSIIIEPL